VTSIGGNLTIYSTSYLSSLTGLENVTSIGGDLDIEASGLTSLGALENLTSIEGNLTIAYCGTLTNLTGLDNIDAGSIQDLSIHHNSSLSDCVVQSICNYLATPGGTIYITANHAGCITPAQVNALCHVGLENYPEKGICTIYPNPSPSQFTFEFYLQQQSIVHLVVHNSLGQVVATPADRELAPGTHQLFWNSGNLPAGIYYCRLQAGDRMVSSKIIKTQ
jgi:hypothetical protein